MGTDMEIHFSRISLLIPFILFLSLITISWININTSDDRELFPVENFARNSGLKLNKGGIFDEEIISGNYSGYLIGISIIAASGSEFGCIFVYTQFNVRLKKRAPYYLFLNKKRKNIIDGGTCPIILDSIYNINCKEKNIAKNLLTHSSLHKRIIESGLSHLSLDGYNLSISFPNAIKDAYLLRKNLNLLIDIACEVDQPIQKEDKGAIV